MLRCNDATEEALNAKYDNLKTQPRLILIYQSKDVVGFPSEARIRFPDVRYITGIGPCKYARNVTGKCRNNDVKRFRTLLQLCNSVIT